MKHIKPQANHQPVDVLIYLDFGPRIILVKILNVAISKDLPQLVFLASILDENGPREQQIKFDDMLQLRPHTRIIDFMRRLYLFRFKQFNKLQTHISQDKHYYSMVRNMVSGMKYREPSDANNE